MQREVLSKWLVALFAAGMAPGASSANRCVTAQGQVVYTDASCESIGARHEREVKQDGISVVAPMPPGAAPPKPQSSTRREAAAPARVFRKLPRAPTLTVCYDPRDARGDVPSRFVEASIRQAVALWNAGCNVNYEFAGLCPADDAAWRPGRLIDYKVWWASWDESLTIPSDPGSTFRDRAVAAASPKIGVALNRALSVPAQMLQAAIAHEFGHVLGVGHSPNPGDLMYLSARQPTPTAADLDACNAAVEARFGVRAADN